MEKLEQLIWQLQKLKAKVESLISQEMEGSLRQYLEYIKERILFFLGQLRIRSAHRLKQASSEPSFQEKVASKWENALFYEEKQTLYERALLISDELDYILKSAKESTFSDEMSKEVKQVLGQLQSHRATFLKKASLLEE